MFYFIKNDHKIIVKCRWGSGYSSRSADGSWSSPVGVLVVKPLQNVGLFISRGQISYLKKKKSSTLIYFEYKFDANLFLSFKILGRLSFKLN